MLVPFVTTKAVRLPAVGFAVTFTTSIVKVAEVTVPVAPLFRVTTLFAAVESKPNPLIINVVSSAARLTVLLVTTPMTLATWSAEPLEREFVETIAVRLPTATGFTANVTVRALLVADVTVPEAPSLNTTVL